MKNSGEDIAIIDIGSNSVRLFIFRIVGTWFEQIASKKFFCGLGRDLGVTGRLNPEAVAATRAHLKDFRQDISQAGIQTEIVIGTAALREAADAGDFIAAVRADTGFDIKPISGEEEARLAALAVLSSDRHASGVVADFGGGSLELARIGNGGIERKVSLRLGAHYLKALPDAKSAIDRELQKTLDDMPEFGGVTKLFIIGGSWRSLAKAWLQDRGRDDAIAGFRFPANDIADFCDGIAKREPNELAEVYQLEGPRAQIMDVSALMLGRLIAWLEPQEIEVSVAGIRDGLAYDYMLRRQ